MGIFRNPAVIITLILLVVLLFGAKRLPDVAKSVGASLKIFKKEVKELTEDDEDKPRAADTNGTAASAGTSEAAQPAARPAEASTAPAGPNGTDTSQQATGSPDPKNT